MLAAIWLHDIVYDPRRHDNEERSAEQASVDLAGSDIDAGIVADLILGTKHHEVATVAQRLLNDLDLMILDMPRDRYAAYTRHIRMEYAHVPAADYAAGRARILEQFDAKRIYQTPGFAHLETAAHENLRMEIAELRATA